VAIAAKGNEYLQVLASRHATASDTSPKLYALLFRAVKTPPGRRSRTNENDAVLRAAGCPGRGGPEPTAGPGDLLIRVHSCSICGTNARIWRSGHPNLRPPRVLGHEVAGEVVEVSEGADGWSAGDRSSNRPPWCGVIPRCEVVRLL
jgi:hypothetical protein